VAHLIGCHEVEHHVHVEEQVDDALKPEPHPLRRQVEPLPRGGQRAQEAGGGCDWTGGSNMQLLAATTAICLQAYWSCSCYQCC
jgi:hypothetical protein